MAPKQQTRFEPRYPRAEFLSRSTIATLAALTLWSLALPSVAQAQCGSSCFSFCPAHRAVLFGVTVAPTLAPNARILARLTGVDPASAQLDTSSGAPIPFALEPAGDASGTAFWIVPAAPLAPGSYLFSITHSAWGTVVSQAFSVRPGDDTTAPSLRGLDVRAVADGDYCSELIGAWISWDSGLEVDPLGSVLAVEVELWRDGVMFARLFPAPPSAARPTEIGTSPRPDCFGAAHVEGLIEGEELTARVRVWDMAGNATAFESRTFTVGRSPAVPHCESCSAAPWRRGPIGSLGSSFLVALLVVVYRGRRPPTFVAPRASSAGGTAGATWRQLLSSRASTSG